MKKVLLVLALLVGFAASSFAQVGQGKCALNLQSTPNNEKLPTAIFTDIVLLGISDSEGDPAYSVSLTADFKLGKASKVVLTETKTGKKWLMNQVTPMTTPAPMVCNAGQGLPVGTMVYRSSLTNVVVYVSVPFDSFYVTVYAYKPLDIKLKI